MRVKAKMPIVPSSAEPIAQASFAGLALRRPIIQALMAGVSNPALAAAVSEAGGLGSIGVGATDAQGARTMIEEMRARTDRAFNVNVFVHATAKADVARETAWLEWLAPLFGEFGVEPPSTLRTIYRSFADDPDMLALLLEVRPPAVSFHFGLPSAGVIAALRACGICLIATATSPKEARMIERAGLDAIVAQGIEAGGHRGVFDPDAPDDKLGTMALTRMLVRGTRLPVIAAGGIMDGAGIAAALDLGAVAAQLGTAFIGCPESAADAGYRTAIAGRSASYGHDAADFGPSRACARQPLHCARRRDVRSNSSRLSNCLRRRESTPRCRKGPRRSWLRRTLGRPRGAARALDAGEPADGGARRGTCCRLQLGKRRARMIGGDHNGVCAVNYTGASVPYTTETTTFHTAQVEGLKIFYREAGPKDAPTIVLLHGYPSSSRMWNSLIPLLAGRYHLIAPDYPGFGLSEAPAPDRYTYTFDQLAQTTSALLHQLGITRYTLFMQDYGGPVGFRIAMNAPEKVPTTIIQNANAYQEGLGAKWADIAKYWTDPAAHPEQVDAFLGYEGTRARHLGTSPNPDRYDPDAWTDEYALLSRPGQRAIQAALLYDYRTNIAFYPRRQAWLGEHKPALLVMWGRYDPSFIVPGGEGYKRDVPEAELHILDAGHFALEGEDRTNRAVYTRLPRKGLA